MSEANLKGYYTAHVHEYEQAYLKPERQDDLWILRTRLRELLSRQRILEVACGTGYWTAAVAEVVEKIVATDINPAVLEMAKKKTLPLNRVQFLKADAYSLANLADNFSAGFAGFWWSHIPRSRLPQFLDAFHARLSPHSLVVFVDNRYVAGSNHPITRADAEGNTYQLRQLANGVPYEVLKNFPAEAELRQALGARACDLRYEALTYYWCLSYRVN